MEVYMKKITKISIVILIAALILIFGTVEYFKYQSHKDEISKDQIYNNIKQVCNGLFNNEIRNFKIHMEKSKGNLLFITFSLQDSMEVNHFGYADYTILDNGKLKYQKITTYEANDIDETSDVELVDIKGKTYFVYYGISTNENIKSHTFTHDNKEVTLKAKGKKFIEFYTAN